ncbi:hypothetical protein A2V80_00700 [Candidatus Woesebacteria bacterium RBG_16_39_8b]|uniref:Uncharacterized protein n=1 Tax=Candidatus Woesebacteria bacterium RBG_16_39_8b TaxID=1802482 RepID=A0A1F7XGW8_9BACT|nr:MAG: hypothetical protein A2V80_00700 [Candidatus Woesebacteria bacterium RBG_16_39_8b]
MWVEISQEELSKHDWEFYRRIDGHVFTVLVRQGTDIGKALLEGKGIYARHQLKDVRGDLMQGSHIDFLEKGKLQEQQIMDTVYNPSIGHQSLVIIVKKD